ANPADDAPLTRIMNFPARGIGSRSLEQLTELAKEKRISLWAAALLKAEGGRRKEEGQAASALNSAPMPHSLSFRGIPGFVALVEHMRTATRGLPLPEVIEHVIEASGLRAHYQAERDGADRLENLAELINAAETFVAERDVQPAVETSGMDAADRI